MSIATELQNYETYLENAYDKAEEKGATMPQNKNLQNLTACIDSIGDYIELDFIETSGTQFIDTNYSAYKTKFEAKFRLTNTTGYSGNGYLAGAWNDNNNRYYPMTEENAVAHRFSCATRENNQIIFTSSVDTNIHTVVYNDENNRVWFDNINKGTLSDLTTQTTRPIFLFALNGSAGEQQFFRGRIYYIKITDKNTNTFVRNFVPAYRTSDGEVGMLDKVNNIFYTNSGTGKFVGGFEPSI